MLKASMKSNWIRIFLVVELGWYMGGCSSATSIDQLEELIVRMFGVYEAPTDAVGDSDPQWQLYTLEQVLLTMSDTSETINIVSAEQEAKRIINRSQIIFRASMADYKDKTISGLSLVFNGEVTGASKDKEDYSVNFPTTTFTLVQELTITKGQDTNLTARVKWRNTVGTNEETGEEIMSPPEIEMTTQEIE